jgi:hypothetical protein
MPALFLYSYWAQTVCEEGAEEHEQLRIVIPKKTLTPTNKCILGPSFLCFSFAEQNKKSYLCFPYENGI